jgi:hypothetical protein
MMRSALRLSSLVVVALAIIAMVLAAGSVPHVHDDPEAGVYNQEHDLTLLAGLGSHALEAESPLLPALDVTVMPVMARGGSCPPSDVSRDSAPRAPPSRSA